jgi:hypothetical protein
MARLQCDTPLVGFLILGSQCVLIKFPNESPSSQLMCSSRCSLDSSTTLLSRMLCPKLLSFHVCRWARGMVLLSSNGNHFGSLQHFKFFVNFNIFHKKGSMSSKCSKNKNTYILLDFDTQTSLNIIIVLNL